MTVGIFVVIYYVAFFAAMCVGYFPPAMPFLTIISGLLCGIPFMVFLTKIKKLGCILLFGTVCGLISLAMGSGVMPLIFAVVQLCDTLCAVRLPFLVFSMVVYALDDCKDFFTPLSRTAFSTLKFIFSPVSVH